MLRAKEPLPEKERHRDANAPCFSVYDGVFLFSLPPDALENGAKREEKTEKTKKMDVEKMKIL